MTISEPLQPALGEPLHPLNPPAKRRRSYSPISLDSSIDLSTTFEEEKSEKSEQEANILGNETLKVKKSEEDSDDSDDEDAATTDDQGVQGELFSFANLYNINNKLEYVVNDFASIEAKLNCQRFSEKKIPPSEFQNFLFQYSNQMIEFNKFFERNINLALKRHGEVSLSLVRYMYTYFTHETFLTEKESSHKTAASKANAKYLHKVCDVDPKKKNESPNKVSLSNWLILYHI